LAQVIQPDCCVRIQSMRNAVLFNIILALGIVAYEAARPYSRAPCRYVLVSVNKDFMNGMFQNWFRSAKPFLDGNQLLIEVDRTDSEARERLAEMKAELGTAQLISASEILPTVTGKERERERDRQTGEHNSLLQKTDVLWDFLSPEYRQMMSRRVPLIQHYVQQCSVLHVDVDAVWIKDPFPAIEEAADHDFIGVSDSCRPGPPDMQDDSKYFCGCFMLFNPSSKWGSFFDQWSVATFEAGGNEQRGLGKTLKSRSDVSVAWLPYKQFPPGCEMLASPGNSSDAAVIHANYMIGMDNKIAFFKSLGLW